MACHNSYIGLINTIEKNKCYRVTGTSYAKGTKLKETGNVEALKFDAELANQ